MNSSLSDHLDKHGNITTSPFLERGFQNWKKEKEEREIQLLFLASVQFPLHLQRRKNTERNKTASRFFCRNPSRLSPNVMRMTLPQNEETKTSFWKKKRAATPGQVHSPDRDGASEAIYYTFHKEKKNKYIE